jgi:hypothetical protein
MAQKLPRHLLYLLIEFVEFGDWRSAHRACKQSHDCASDAFFKGVFATTFLPSDAEAAPVAGASTWRERLRRRCLMDQAPRDPSRASCSRWPFLHALELSCLPLAFGSQTQWGYVNGALVACHRVEGGQQQVVDAYWSVDPVTGWRQQGAEFKQASLARIARNLHEYPGLVVARPGFTGAASRLIAVYHHRRQRLSLYDAADLLGTRLYDLELSVGTPEWPVYGITVRGHAFAVHCLLYSSWCLVGVFCACFEPCACLWLRFVVPPLIPHRVVCVLADVCSKQVNEAQDRAAAGSLQGAMPLVWRLSTGRMLVDECKRAERVLDRAPCRRRCESGSCRSRLALCSCRLAGSLLLVGVLVLGCGASPCCCLSGLTPRLCVSAALACAAPAARARCSWRSWRLRAALPSETTLTL